MSTVDLVLCPFLIIRPLVVESLSETLKRVENLRLIVLVSTLVAFWFYVMKDGNEKREKCNNFTEKEDAFYDEDPDDTRNSADANQTVLSDMDDVVQSKNGCRLFGKGKTVACGN